LDILISDLDIPIEKDGLDEYVKAVSERLKLFDPTLRILKILSKSLDTSCKDQFYYRLSVVARVPDGFKTKTDCPVYTEKPEVARKAKPFIERPLIIGFGPAGMFAALEFLAHGIRPLIFERGKKLEDRDADVQRFIKERTLDPESNIQFGEGGAGAYSDGKLFSRAKNSTHANRVLDTLIRFGAPEEIGYIRKPHLGTDVLCGIVRNIRSHILDRGGEIHYSSRMTDLLTSNGEVSGVVINGKREVRSSSLYLATGHSARDTFELLHKKGIALERKPVSVGVRIEHPSELIRRIRYGDTYGSYSGLGAPAYSFHHTPRKTGRGVYTFCMCPGGEIVNASSENGLLVLNGMSYHDRASEFSNSALIVSCPAEEDPSADPLAGIRFQEEIERKAFHAAGGGWKAPAQNLMDFLEGRLSAELHPNSYKMGTVPVDLNEILPKEIGEALIRAFGKWEGEEPLFVSEQAILLSPETRTSSPVRIRRNKLFESVNMKNLFPIGEGSGYAGGITSSAMDAIKAVEQRLGLPEPA